MHKQNLRERLMELLDSASPYQEQQHNRTIVQQFYTALAATKPDEQLRAWRHRPIRSRYDYLDALAQLQLDLMRGDWYLICSALQDLVYFYPVTFAPIRASVLSALEEKLQEEIPHETD